MSDSTTAGDARTDDDESATIEPSDLSKFQVRVLATLSNHGGAPKGLEIKERLRSYYLEEINHGRLYPNLDKLVNAGFVEKGAKDRRTNSYRLTDEGRSVLTDEIAWLVSRVGEVPETGENGGDGE